MNTFAACFILLIGVTAIIHAIREAFSSKRRTPRQSWLALLASMFLVVGITGFFGSAFSAVGGLNWLPESFEWPVGDASGIIQTDYGQYVVPHTPSGRVQVYDSDWYFLRGWHVDANGGTFDLVPLEDNRFEVITSRESQRYVFNTLGELLSKSKYSHGEYSSVPKGISHHFPTPFWLLVFSHPFNSWCVAALGILMHIVASKIQ